MRERSAKIAQGSKRVAQVVAGIEIIWTRVEGRGEMRNGFFCAAGRQQRCAECVVHRRLVWADAVCLRKIRYCFHTLPRPINKPAQLLWASQSPGFFCKFW